MATNVLTGARAIFKVGANKVAFASNVDVGEEIQYEPVEVLDNIEVQEYAPVGYRVSFTCGIFRTIKGSAAINSLPGTAVPDIGAGDTPGAGQFGSLIQMGIWPQEQNILTSGVLTCTITDRITGTTLMTLQEAKASNNNYSVTARGIVGQQLSFVAIRIKSEGST